MKKKVVVTGGTGYIGSHTAVELILSGYEVLIVDNFSNSSHDVLDRIEQLTGVKPVFEKLDATDFNALDDFLTRHRNINSIIHFAASKAVGESVDKPLHYYRNNLVSLINILELMQKYSIGGIVFSSSCTVYGQPDVLPVTESTPFKPAASPYGRTKQMCEEILSDACVSAKRINAIALRYFNPVGAHSSGLIGELPNGVPSNLVPFITQTAAGIRKELQVFGNDYATPDGSALRDYIHVVDLAKAHVAALERQLSGQQAERYEYFNIGTGTALSVLQLIQTFEMVNQVQINYKIVGRRSGDIEQIFADTTRANRELGWKASLGVQEMMRSAWVWQQALMQRSSMRATSAMV